MRRFLIFLVLTALFSLVYWALLRLHVDRLSGWVPEGDSLLEEAPRRSW